MTPDFVGYHDLKKLAEGRERVVYSGVRNDGTPVVLKALRSEHPSVDMIALMYHEYEVSKNLDFPGILKTYGLIDQENQYALVLENMHGISLRDYLQANPIHDLSQFFSLSVQMANILGTLHQQNIIHKDIKPSNFIIHPETLVEKLTDFNYSSKLLHEVQDIVPPNKLEGTLAYMAPEQTGRMNMNIDYRCDFYALGVTFYEMLAGELPYLYNDPLELLHAHLANAIPEVVNPLFDIPPVLKRIIQKLMSKNPSDRYQSAIGLQADLERCKKTLTHAGDIEDFDLGQDDVHDRLNISQKIYGRETEAEILLNAYDRVSHGKVEALMVCGYSGIGKTMLINEVHKPMVKHKGYFINGKFDQLQRNTPYTAMTQAFNQLARLILAEPEARFEAIKNDIINALGGVAQIIIDLAPDFELIIGLQPSLEKLPPLETQNRMMIFFKRFLQAIANQEHPLVLFIDDLQWIDSGTLKLFEQIMMDDELTHVLLIGAYRDNEVEVDHPLRQLLMDIHDKGKKTTSLPLKPLTPTHFEALLKDSFDHGDASIKNLAKLIHKRTDGNPFFCKQVIRTIYQRKLLYFDYELRRWNWDLDGIITLKITENVVDLMLSKLDELPAETQELLKYAACVGNRFTVQMLILTSNQSADAIGHALWPALQLELLYTLHLGYKRMDAMGHENIAALISKDIIYQFTHDRVQQTVYQNISADEKQKTHLSIGRLMVEKEPEACKKERLFEVVDHFNQAHMLLKESEKIIVAGLNYQAADRARNASAYMPMSNYLTEALSLMDESWWENHYDFTFKVNRDYALSLLLLNKITDAGTFIENLLARSKTNLDKASLYRLQVMSYGIQGKIEKLLETGQAASAFLGVKYPTHPTRFHLFVKLAKVRWLMRRFHLTTIDTELPILQDTSIEGAFEILIEIMSYWGCRSLIYYTYGQLLGVELLLRYGKPRSASYWVVSYGQSILNIFMNANYLFESLPVLDRLIAVSEDKYSSSMTNENIGSSAHLRYPIPVGKEYCEHAIQDAMESGNIFEKVWCNILLTDNMLVEAKSLKNVLSRAKINLKTAIDGGLKDFREYVEIDCLLYESMLLDKELPADRMKVLDLVLAQSEHLVQTWSSRKRTFYYYFMESFEQAIYYSQIWYRRHKQVRFLPFDYDAKTTLALTLAKCIPNVRGLAWYRYQRRFRQIMQELKWVAKECPGNYLHQYLLIIGTKLRLASAIAGALSTFDESIKHSKKGNFYLWTAVANELAGEMLTEHNQPRSAIDYIREAHYYYGRYGMAIKVKTLEKRYPQCFIEQTAIKKDTLYDSTSTTSASLDYLSVIKASQAISGEIILDKLLEKMLHICVENAGADRALFLEPQKGKWVATATLEVRQGQEQFKMLKMPLTELHDIPLSVFQYALRSNEPVVLSNAAEDSQFSDDAFITRTQSKSILCLPVMYQDHISGIIYLENNLIMGAFTQDRVIVLSTLSAQIAISLENARHFEHTELLYRSTERFVPKPFLELLQKKNIEEVKRGDSVEREISVLFNDIRSFTTLVEKRKPKDAFAFVNRYWEFMAPVIQKFNGYIDQYQGDAILAIFPQNADDAVNAAIAMMNALADFNKLQLELGDVTINMGIGVSTGPAMLGIIGEESRQIAGLISDVANTAARIEGLNKIFHSNILLSGDTLAKLTSTYDLRQVEKARLKGKELTTNVYEVIDWQAEIRGIELNEYILQYNKAFNLYTLGDFKAALEGFKICLGYNPEDAAAKVLVNRCEKFLIAGPPKGWDGTVTLLEK